MTCFILISMCFLAIFSQLIDFYAICAIFTPVQLIMSLLVCPHIALVHTPVSNSQVVTFKGDIVHLLSTKILKIAKTANFSIFWIFIYRTTCDEENFKNLRHLYFNTADSLGREVLPYGWSSREWGTLHVMQIVKILFKGYIDF